MESEDAPHISPEDTASRLVDAGGRIPGQPAPWPDTIELDPDLYRLLTRLAALS